MRYFHELKYQHGAATLLTAMALMMVTASMVLASVHAQLLNARANGNVQDSVKNYLLAEAGLDYAIEHLQKQYYQLIWENTNDTTEIHKAAMPVPWLQQLDTNKRKIHLTFSRSLQRPAYVEITAQVTNTLTGQNSLEIKQLVRPLSILSPDAEHAPPLVIDGCVIATSGTPDLYPGKRSGNPPSPAIWSSRKPGCHKLANLDLHEGVISSQRFDSGDLWNFMFSVDRTDFTKLVTDELTRKIDKHQRRYMMVSKSDLQSGRWTHSLGSPQHPVLLLFPAKLGCPAITTGTVIYGIVFYEADCSTTSLTMRGEIYGTLAINGSLGVYSEYLELAHISQASDPEPLLKFPILKVPRLIGTWQDF